MAIYVSPTLLAIRVEEANPPPLSAACRTCPSSVWFTVPEPAPATDEDGLVVVKCYCTRMHLLTWSEEQPPMPTACDGQAIGLAQLQQKGESDD
jgi:hypothetical protein